MELSKVQVSADLPVNLKKVSDSSKASESRSDLSGNGEDPPKVWHCDIYCRKIRHVVCEGKDRADSSASELCPYFDEMLY